MYKQEEERFAAILRTVVSFLVAAAVPAMIFACFFVFTYVPNTLPKAIFGYLIIFAYGLLVAATHIIVLGVPTFLLGIRLRAIRWWSAIIMAFVIGGLPFAISTWPDYFRLGAAKYIYGFSVWGLFGASGGLVFWLLWHFWVHRESS